MGWETRDFTAESGLGASGSGVSIDTTIFRSGSAALKIAAVSGAQGRHQVGATALWHRFYIRVTALPAVAARPIAITNAAVQTDIKLNPAGTLTWGGVTSATALTDTTRWYRISVRTTTSTSSLARLRIDGVDAITFAADSGTQLTNLGTGVDTVPDTYTVYYDDLVSDDTNEPGEGSVVLLLPVSDNTDNAWTKPAGNQVDNYTSVNNTPPVGVADSTALAQAENQIRNPTSNTSYVANMATYSSAGILAADTINFVRAIVIHAAPVSTGAKIGSVQITANPAEGAARAFQSPSSFYYSGVNAGTYPTGWKVSFSTGASAPSVTVGTNPTLSMNVTGGTATRIGMCCFLGMYVDYTPAVVAAPIPPSSFLQAVKRGGYF